MKGGQKVERKKKWSLNSHEDSTALSGYCWGSFSKIIDSGILVNLSVTTLLLKLPHTKKAGGRGCGKLGGLQGILLLLIC